METQNKDDLFGQGYTKKKFDVGDEKENSRGDESIKTETTMDLAVPDVSAFRKMMEISKVLEEMRTLAIAKLKAPTVYDYGNSEKPDAKDKPYLSADALIPIGKDFLISTLDLIPKEIYLEDEKGQIYAFSISGKVAWIQDKKIIRQIESFGYCDTRNKFFGKISRKDENGKDHTVCKPLSEIDKRDIQNTAFTRFLRRGYLIFLGLTNITWEELKSITGIDRSKCPKIAFHTGTKGGDRAMTENQKKTVEKMFGDLKKKIGGDMSFDEYCIENAGVKFADFKFSDASKMIQVLSLALNKKEDKSGNTNGN